MSPITGLGMRVCTFSTRFWSLIVPLIRYFPSAVKETMVAFLPPWVIPAVDGPETATEIAVGLGAAKAALRKPCGVSQISRLPDFGRGRRRVRVGPLHVPGGIAADDQHLLLLSLNRRSAAAARWIGALPAGELLL